MGVRLPAAAMTQEELNAQLAALAEELRGMGVPISREIAPQVEVNSRAQWRLGCCIRKEGSLHHPGVGPAAGPAGIAAKYPSPRAAPHLLRLPKPRKTVESLCPEGGAGFGRGYPADGAGGGILGAPAAGGSEIPAAVPKLWEGHPPAPEV